MRLCQIGKRNTKGFTLIEVLVAFSILSLTLAALFSLFSTSTRNTQVGDEYSYAVLLAESKLAELGITEPLRPGFTRGRFDGSFQWEMRVDKQARRETGQYDEFNWDVLDVSLRLWWDSVGQERELTLSTIRLVARD